LTAARDGNQNGSWVLFDAARTDLRDRNQRAAMIEVQRTAMRMMRTSGFSNVTVEHIAEGARAALR